jgi:hypothetical protein
MPWTIRDDLRLTIRLGLTRGLRLVHGMRRKLTEEERSRVADAIIDQLHLSNYEISREGRAMATGRN